MSTVDRLIADRGHGLTRPQVDALRAAAAGKLRRDELSPQARFWIADGPTVKWPTVRALARLDLIERGERLQGERYSAYRLTLAGVALARRMGIEAPYPTPERTAEADRRLAEATKNGPEDSWWEGA